MSDLTRMPPPADFLFRTPLYRRYLLLGNEPDLDQYGGPVDCYCICCRKEGTFKNEAVLKQQRKNQRLDLLLNGIIVEPGHKEIMLSCTRCGHTYHFCFFVTDHYSNPPDKDPFKYFTIQKIGQYPSYSDLNSHDLSKYRKILGPKFKELSKAVQLASHDIGIAAFTYLRRVFESLIEGARAEAAKAETWNDEVFRVAKMDKKISALNAHLPPFLVDNAKLYAILSKGVHELTEEECLDYFPVIRSGIELILDQKIDIIAREKKEKENREAIQRLHQKLV